MEFNELGGHLNKRKSIDLSENNKKHKNSNETNSIEIQDLEMNTTQSDEKMEFDESGEKLDKLYCLKKAQVSFTKDKTIMTIKFDPSAPSCSNQNYKLNEERQRNFKKGQSIEGNKNIPFRIVLKAGGFGESSSPQNPPTPPICLKYLGVLPNQNEVENTSSTFRQVVCPDSSDSDEDISEEEYHEGSSDLQDIISHDVKDQKVMVHFPKLDDIIETYRKIQINDQQEEEK